MEPGKGRCSPASPSARMAVHSRRSSGGAGVATAQEAATVEGPSPPQGRCRLRAGEAPSAAGSACKCGPGGSSPIRVP